MQSASSLGSSIHLASQTGASITDDLLRKIPSRPEDRNKLVHISNVVKTPYDAVLSDIREVQTEVEAVVKLVVPILHEIRKGSFDFRDVNLRDFATRLDTQKKQLFVNIRPFVATVDGERPSPVLQLFVQVAWQLISAVKDLKRCRACVDSPGFVATFRSQTLRIQKLFNSSSNGALFTTIEEIMRDYVKVIAPDSVKFVTQTDVSRLVQIVSTMPFVKSKARAEIGLFLELFRLSQSVLVHKDLEFWGQELLSTLIDDAKKNLKLPLVDGNSYFEEKDLLRFDGHTDSSCNPPPWSAPRFGQEPEKQRQMRELSSRLQRIGLRVSKLTKDVRARIEAISQGDSTPALGTETFVAEYEIYRKVIRTFDRDFGALLVEACQVEYDAERTTTFLQYALAIHRSFKPLRSAYNSFLSFTSDPYIEVFRAVHGVDAYRDDHASSDQLAAIFEANKSRRVADQACPEELAKGAKVREHMRVEMAKIVHYVHANKLPAVCSLGLHQSQAAYLVLSGKAIVASEELLHFFAKRMLAELFLPAKLHSPLQKDELLLAYTLFKRANLPVPEKMKALFAAYDRDLPEVSGGYLSVVSKVYRLFGEAPSYDSYVEAIQAVFDHGDRAYLLFEKLRELPKGLPIYLPLYAAVENKDIAAWEVEKPSEFLKLLNGAVEKERKNMLGMKNDEERMGNLFASICLRVLAACLYEENSDELAKAQRALYNLLAKDEYKGYVALLSKEIAGLILANVKKKEMITMVKKGEEILMSPLEKQLYDGPDGPSAADSKTITLSGIIDDYVRHGRQEQIGDAAQRRKGEALDALTEGWIVK